ncbi:MAG: hypothetical protein IJK38_02820 [Oscillospiraceae bacterium]|nr:hypothetical protein [Oscillospiraceae bacterium]
MNNAYWIWLDRSSFPDLQTSRPTIFDSSDSPFAIVQFQNEYRFTREIKEVCLRVSADCRFRISCNGQYLGMGPAFPGGDWDRRDPMPQRYSDLYRFSLSEPCLLLEAEVQLSPTLLCDISDGNGGFFLEGEVIFTDREKAVIGTDTSWLCRVDRRWKNDLFFDGRIKCEPWQHAVMQDRQHPLLSEIPVNESSLLLPDGDSELETISAGTICCEIEADAPYEIRMIPYETPDLEDEPEIICGSSSLVYEGFRIRSVGGIRTEIISGTPVIRKIAVRATQYPGDLTGYCKTTDDLNLVMETCEKTLRLCRQSIHLDSPRHMEPLGCTGDYWIESLMEYYCFSDHRLTRFDLVRTARLLCATDGFMFHTGYSLIWLSMLQDYLLYTGDDSVLAEVEDAVRILLNRFQSYENEEGILDSPPNYMFVDWVEIAGYSMHHPPKALGQTILNALYYRSLMTAADLLGESAFSHRAEVLKAAFDSAFWDPSEEMYISGKTGFTPTNEWLPENAAEPIFTLHANVMAAACGICTGTRAQQLMHKVLSDPSLPDYQPYFAHFVFQALWNTDLFDAYAIPLLQRWVPVVKACPKGLAEGWIKPCDGYVFDHSHAWGGCPRYWLPRALIGLDILEKGFRKISLRSRMTGIADARVAVPTPYGLLECEVTSGKVHVLNVPSQIQIVN